MVKRKDGRSNVGLRSSMQQNREMKRKSEGEERGENQARTVQFKGERNEGNQLGTVYLLMDEYEANPRSEKLLTVNQCHPDSIAQPKLKPKPERPPLDCLSRSVGPSPSTHTKGDQICYRDPHKQHPVLTSTCGTGLRCWRSKLQYNTPM